MLGKTDFMRTILIALLMTLATQAGAEFFYANSEAESPKRLSKLELQNYSVTVTLNDFATGACWTNLKEVREYAEEKLKIAGLKVLPNNDISDADTKLYTFAINLIAARVYADGSGPCVGSSSVEMAGWTFVNGLPHIAVLGRRQMSISSQRQNYNRSMIDVLEKVFADFPKN